MLNNYSQKWSAFTGIALLSFGCYLDYTVVNIALPTIQQQLQATITSLQWVMNIYFLALCILAAIMGRCGDLYGRRRIFYIGILVFALASLVAGFAHTIGWLIFGRLLQGIGAAIVIPLGPSLLPQAFPEGERAKVIGWLGSMGGIALALGPVLGGLIVTHWGWRWIFFINIPIIVLGFLFCLGAVKESVVTQNDRSLDWLGMWLLVPTMGGLVLGVINSESLGWENPVTIVCLAVGLIAGIVMVKVENAKTNPLIDFADFLKLLFYAGGMIAFLSGVLSAVALFFNPIYLQIIRGESVQLSGLVLFAIPVVVFIVAMMVGWLIEQMGIIYTIIIGLAVAALSGLLQALFVATSPLWFVLFAFVCLGVTWAMGNTVSIIAAHKAVSHERLSVATGTIVTLFNIGGSMGLAVSVVVYNRVANAALHHIFSIQQSTLPTEQQFRLAALIANPAQSAQAQMPDLMHKLFNYAFMHGFSAAMWFLMIVSGLALLTVLLWQLFSKKRAG